MKFFCMFYVLAALALRAALSRDCSLTHPIEGDGAVFSIAADCDFYSAAYLGPSGSDVSIFPRHGSIGSNQCKVYQGLNATGAMLGTYTEQGYREGMFKTSGSNELFISCELMAHAHELMAFFVQPYVTACSDVTLTSDHLPAHFVIPGEEGRYLNNLACQMVVRSNGTCAFTVAMGPNTDISPTDGLFISSDDPFKVPVRIMSSGSSIVGARNVTFVGKELKVDFATGGGTQRAVPNIVVYAECQNPRANVACGDKVAINVTDLALVHAERGDTLYIANTATHDISGIPANCKAVVGDFALLEFDISECQSDSKETEHLLVYTYTIRNRKAIYGLYPIFRNAVTYSFEFTCSYPSSRTLKSHPQRLIPVMGSQLLDPEIEMGEFTLNFNLYSTQAMSDPLPYDSVILVPAYIYGKVELFGLPQNEQRFILEIQDCWITQMENLNSQPQYRVIQNGCKVNNTYDPSQGVVVTRNHESRFGTFQFQSFLWTNSSDRDQAIYAHCHVKICDNEIRTCFKPNCENTRRRRGIERINFELDETVTAGPIIMSKSRTSKCSKCSDLCHIQNSKGICSCYSNRVLSANGQDCQDKPEKHSASPDSSSIPIFALIGVVVALFFIIILLVALVRYRCGDK